MTCRAEILSKTACSPVKKSDFATHSLAKINVQMFVSLLKLIALQKTTYYFLFIFKR